MKKDHDKWNKLKKCLDAREHYPTFKEREIWWCDLGINIGYEMDGSESESDFARPVLILRRYNKYTAWMLPLTRTKKDLPFYHIIKAKDLADSCISLSQGRLISSKRLRTYIVKIPISEFQEIQDEVSSLIYGGKK